MANRFPRLKLIWRLSILATLCVSTAYLWDGSRAWADSGTTCAQCDSNNSTAQGTCYSQYSTCFQNCNDFINPGCTANCHNAYESCQAGAWTNYDNCLYGFTNFSGICALSNQSGQTATGKGKTQCDRDCYDQMRDCRENGGETCGGDFESCKMGCG